MAYTNFTGKNVLFLQGSQDNLNNLIKNGEAIEGAFYLTQDTHRLYVGRKNDEGKIFPVAVNEGVVTVDNVEALPSSGINAGEFYYATNENILCVYNGSNFVQINSNTDTKNKELAITIDQPKIGETEEKENKANIEVKVTDDVKGHVEDSYTITDASKRNVITASGKVIDIKGDAYTLSAADGGEGVAVINLNSENTDNDTNINLKAGENISLDVNGKDITIKSSFKDTKINSGNITLNEDGSISGLLIDSDNTNIPITASKPITYKIDNQPYIPGSTLPVYTQTQIDKKLKDLNGLTYKGTVGTTALPTKEVEAGWMYLVDALIEVEESKSATGNTIYATAGDLLVASGEDEDDNGYLTTIQWTYIPSGDDTQTDTRYLWNSDVTANKKILKEANGAQDVVGSWKLEKGDVINITSSEETTGDLKTTISHAEVAHTNAEGDEKTNVVEVTAVTAVEVDAYGHTTKVETTKHTIKDTTYTLSGTTVAAATKGVIITDTLTDSDNGSSQSNLTVTSDTLKLTAGTGAYNIDIVWGSF